MGVGSFAAGNAVAPAVSNDPYANIDIDLSKVKKAEKPSKPFEQRTEEEKAAKSTENKTGGESTKSNLKKKQEDNDSKNRKEVRFGKSTTYQLENTNESVDDDTVYNNEGTK